MDNQLPTQSSLRPPFNKKRIAFIVFLTFVILVSIITLSIKVLPVNLSQKEQRLVIPSPVSTKNSTASGIPINVQESSPSSEGIRSDSKDNIIGFSGKVKEKGGDYLILIGGNKTIKIEINNQLVIREINKIDFSKNPELYLAQPPQIMPLSEIRIGDDIDTLGNGNETALKAVSLTVFK